ncbi:Homeobox-like_domain superfamily [Hexamita inflata]|uniref:Homeobox-like domain superfamily n=1 Tax=Hexamita inflata TaxID=28002 RepID=A0AA86RHI5_9EUKA|nr:Homeobox-like domain superfamily [Hexamita inflata]
MTQDAKIVIHNNTPWTLIEQQIFFAYYELYQNDFHSYEQHLNRSYSQIKAFFHNWLRKQPEEVKAKYKLGQRGGRHFAYRNNDTSILKK